MSWPIKIIVLGVLAWCSAPVHCQQLRVVCYYANWSTYRSGIYTFLPGNIDPQLCTHLVYAFGGMNNQSEIVPLDKWLDITNKGYVEFNNLKTFNRNLKTLLAIGGWNEGSTRFSNLVTDPKARTTFSKNAVNFLRKHDFDGLDLYWQHPNFRVGSRQTDRENYVLFVRELREEFDREAGETGREKLLLTMAVPASPGWIEEGYDVAGLQGNLDYMSILSYDYHTAFAPVVNHHSALRPISGETINNRELNVEYTLNYYFNLGAQRDKLVLGIPIFGRSYTLFSASASTLGSLANGPGFSGNVSMETGYMAYSEICSTVIPDEGWSIERQLPDFIGPYAHRHKQWIGYDDEEMVRRKADYVLEKRLAGVMFWAMDLDDFRGDCSNGTTKNTFPLIRAAKERFKNVRKKATAVTQVKTVQPILEQEQVQDLQPVQAEKPFQSEQPVLTIQPAQALQPDQPGKSFQPAQSFQTEQSFQDLQPLQGIRQIQQNQLIPPIQFQQINADQQFGQRLVGVPRQPIRQLEPLLQRPISGTKVIIRKINGGDLDTLQETGSDVAVQIESPGDANSPILLFVI